MLPRPLSCPRRRWVRLQRLVHRSPHPVGVGAQLLALDYRLPQPVVVRLVWPHHRYRPAHVPTSPQHQPDGEQEPHKAGARDVVDDELHRLRPVHYKVDHAPGHNAHQPVEHKHFREMNFKQEAGGQDRIFGNDEQAGQPHPELIGRKIVNPCRGILTNRKRKQGRQDILAIPPVTCNPHQNETENAHGVHRVVNDRRHDPRPARAIVHGDARRRPPRGLVGQLRVELQIARRILRVQPPHRRADDGPGGAVVDRRLDAPEEPADRPARREKVAVVRAVGGVFHGDGGGGRRQVQEWGGVACEDFAAVL